jgi:hypothetical protein
MAKNLPNDAVDILMQAQRRYTNDVEILTRLQAAHKKAGRTKEADDIAAVLEQVKSE